MNADARRRALAILGPIAIEDEPIGPLTTYRVGGRAAILVTARSVADLVRVAEARRASGLEVVVIGRGSNMLVADSGFPGIAVVVRLAEEVVIGEPDDPCRVTASASVALPVLARRTVAASLTGFEWAVGVPGSVGGAVRMNAGGHGSDMAATLVDVDVVDLAVADLDGPAVAAPVDGSGVERNGVERLGVERLGLERLGLGFRSSALTDHQIVVAARIGLAPGDRRAGDDLLAEIVAWRREHQPGGQNCGSVFVNPVPGTVSAGALIDGLGLRGLRLGSAEVSDKHANFILADEGGSAEDVRALMEVVRHRVLDETGHDLRSEVRLIGFSGSPTDASRADEEAERR